MVKTLKRILLQNQEKGSSVEKVSSICSNGTAPLNKMDGMPTYNKTLLLQNQESFGAESKYIASRTKDLPCLFNEVDL